MLAGVLAPIRRAGQPIGRDQGAVEDRVRQSGDRGHRHHPGRCRGSKQIDGLADVPPRGRGADAEPGGQPTRRVTVTQVCQRQQRLLTGEVSDLEI